MRSLHLIFSVRNFNTKITKNILEVKHNILHGCSIHAPSCSKPQLCECDYNILISGIIKTKNINNFCFYDYFI